MMFVCFQGHKYGRRKPTETSVSEFSYLCVNCSLKEHVKIKVIFILRQGMFRWHNLQKSVMFLTHIGTFPAAALAPKGWLNQGLPGRKTGRTNQTFLVFKPGLPDVTECAKSLVNQGIPGKPGYPKNRAYQTLTTFLKF